MRLLGQGTSVWLLVAIFCWQAPQRHAMGLPIPLFSELDMNVGVYNFSTTSSNRNAVSGASYGQQVLQTGAFTFTPAGAGQTAVVSDGRVDWLNSSSGSTRLSHDINFGNSEGWGWASGDGWTYEFVADTSGNFDLSYNVHGTAQGNTGAVLQPLHFGNYALLWESPGSSQRVDLQYWHHPPPGAPAPPLINLHDTGSQSFPVAAGNRYRMQIVPFSQTRTSPGASVNLHIMTEARFDWTIDTDVADLPARTVFVDFGSDAGTPGSGSTPGWPSLLGKLASDTSFPSFQSEEIHQIEAGIVMRLNEMYQDFDIGFVTSAPSTGTYDTIDFKQDTASSQQYPGSGSLGWAPVDWLNHDGAETAEVFADNFDFIIDEYGSTATVGTTERNQAIGELTQVLAKVAAHELGHSYGLQHHDAYGNELINTSATGGTQNDHVMATGVTGMTETEFEATKTFSRYSLAKLEATSSESSEPLVSSNFQSTAEQSSAHNTKQLAQDLDNDMQDLDVSGVLAAVVHDALLGDGNGNDWYKFSTNSDATLTAEVLSREAAHVTNGIETRLHLHKETADQSNNTVFEADFGLAQELWYDREMMDFLPSLSLHEDPLLMNIDLEPGTYYLEVEPVLAQGNSGYYDLFMTLLIDPEPTFLADFDGNGIVDRGDLLVWESGYALNAGSATQAQGDANGDGIVNGIDILIWQREYEGPVIGAAVRAVPEPHALLLLMLAALFGWHGRRNFRTTRGKN